MISRILKKFKNLSKSHRIHKSIGMIVVMLENGASIESINSLFKIDIHSIDDIVRSILKNENGKQYNYNHMKMSLEYQENKSNLQKKLTKNTSYSFVLLGVATLMVLFYVLVFYPIMSSMSLDLGLAENSLDRQLLTARLFLMIEVVVLLFISLGFVIYKSFPEIFKLLALKKAKLVRTTSTLLTLNQYSKSFAFTLCHDETIRDIKLLHKSGFLNLQTQHIDQNVKNGNLIFQGHNSWMIDSYLSMITEGLSKIDVEEVVSSYRIVANNQIDILIKRYSATLKFIVIVCIAVVIYIFYSSLMLPLNAMEVL